MANNNPTELGFATVFKDKNGIIIITMHDHKTIDEFDVININLAIKHKVGETPALKLFHAGANWSMDKKARERAKVESSITTTKARAIVVSNSIKATLFKFLKYFGKQGYPQEFFSDWDEAYNWLLSLNSKKN